MKVLLIAAAGAGGAAARYGISVAVGTRTFPWSTLAINLSGSFVLGLLAKLALDRDWSAAVTLPATVGFLGAFTTFSTFSVETHSLVRDGRAGAAAVYIGVSVVGGVLAAAAGYATALAAGT